MTTKHAKYGKAYNTPTGLQEDNYYEMMYDLMDYVNSKGLTTRQAQSLFTDCFDMILDVNLTDEHTKSNYLKSIAESLDDISKRGIMIYSTSCFSSPSNWFYYLCKNCIPCGVISVTLQLIKDVGVLKSLENVFDSI